jgi:pimeloyl-ACP methyl ester carboxylesterase
MTGRTYVLVHGAFHGGWYWKPVAGRLRRQGHVVYAPTLTGLGERSHLAHTRPTLQTFIEDILQVFRFEELDDVILVGHSFGGGVIGGVADRIAGRLRHLVYFDALVLENGHSAVDRAPAELLERYRRTAQEFSGGLTIPPPDPGYFGITDPAQAAWMKPLLTPHPFGTYLERIALDHPVGNGIATTYVSCTTPAIASMEASRRYARKRDDWTCVDLAAPHNAMVTVPDEVAALLDGIG